jgi:hypothetical protein
MQTTVVAGPRRPKMRLRRRLGLAGLGLLVFLLLVAGVSALSNLFLPAGPATTAQLDPLDKARLAEARQLKRALGDTVWPGFASADIPMIVWNRDYSFLVGLPDPPPEWVPVPGDKFQGQTYFRRSTGPNPQNFTVPVGNAWAASMATKWETDSFLREKFHTVLPPGIAQIFPYRLLIQDSEVQMSLVLHESFHAYQAQVALAHQQATNSVSKTGARYDQVDATMHTAWQAEIALLTQAVRAPTASQAADLARQFLAQRDARRAEYALDPALIDYERGYEWLEGTAKYVELVSWRQAHATTTYAPVPELAADPDFKQYRGFDTRWSQELDQMGRQATEGAEVRLYYTGMAQAVVLDRLGAGWKQRALVDGVYIEDLLRAAVTTGPAD